ncbi:MAG TPA: CocE/NonD family hydrolase, partial [Pyrinomonadaceae bacterium]|nr:CocE/NonD family hydrolase [Pyrinomonadaceae bacterium]
MKTHRSLAAVLAVSLLFSAIAIFAQNPKYPEYPSETPDNFKPTNYGFEYERRDVMIPMRDGVKLHTVILVPNGAKKAPILMTRTPYNATALTSHE